MEEDNHKVNNLPPRRRLGKSTLPEATERYLLEFLSSDDSGVGKFSQFAKGKRTLFGSYSDSSAKALRIQVQNRLHYLRSNPVALKQALHFQGLPCPLHLSSEETPFTAEVRSTPSKEERPPIISSASPKRRLSRSPVFTPGSKPALSQPETSSLFVSNKSPPPRPNESKGFVSDLKSRLPSTIMSVELNNGGVDFHLRAETPWMNAENIFALKSVNVQVKIDGEEFTVTKITIYVPVYDMRDLQQGRYSASLSPDGSVIRLKLPSIPFLFYQDAKKFQAREKSRECKQTVTAHRKVVSKMISDEKKGVKTVSLMLDDESVNNSQFNEGKADELALVRRVRRCAQAWKHNGEKFTQEFTYVTYEVVVDGTEEKLDYMNKAVDELSGILSSKLEIEDEDPDEHEEDDGSMDDDE
jgi:hypothetical protein